MDAGRCLQRERETLLSGVDEVAAAIRVAGVIRLAHAAHEVVDAARVSKRGCCGQEKRIPPRHKRGRQVRRQLVRGVGILLVLRERAEREKSRNVEHGEWHAGLFGNLRGLLQFYDVLLAVPKADGLHPLELPQRPVQARGGVLASGEEDKYGVVLTGSFRHSVSTPISARRARSTAKCGGRLN